MDDDAVGVSSQMFWHFLIWRNLRVVRARSMGAVHMRLDRIARRFGKRWRSGPQRSVYGVWMQANFSDLTYRYCHYGTYGRYLSDYLARQDQPFIFLDIGANQGLFSLLAAQNPHCQHIIALEPAAATHALLTANLAMAKAEAPSIAIKAGLSDTAGPAQLHLADQHSGMAALTAKAGDAGMTETVELMTMAQLDAHIPAHGVIIAKVDVEGHEAIVIDQLLQSAHTARIAGIFYEMDERYADAAAIAARLRGAGLTQFTRYGIRRHYDMLAERAG